MNEQMAFPGVDAEGDGTPGMTLRDYFAAHAMLVVKANDPCYGRDYIEIAAGAYALADAMLKERSK